jgi:hypothetical protein
MLYVVALTLYFPHPSDCFVMSFLTFDHITSHHLILHSVSNTVKQQSWPKRGRKGVKKGKKTLVCFRGVEEMRANPSFARQRLLTPAPLARKFTVGNQWESGSQWEQA